MWKQVSGSHGIAALAKSAGPHSIAALAKSAGSFEDFEISKMLLTSDLKYGKQSKM